MADARRYRRKNTPLPPEVRARALELAHAFPVAEVVRLIWRETGYTVSPSTIFNWRRAA